MRTDRIRIVLWLAAAGLPGLAQAAEDCYWLTDGGRKMVAIADWDFSAAADAPGLMTLPAAPEGAQAILCERDDPVPRPNDFESLLQGKPLFIRAGVGRDAVLTALGSEDGQFKLSVQQGRISEAQRQRIAERLEGFYVAHEALKDD